MKKGEIIATLHKDEGNERGKLVHLHFELRNGWSERNRTVNPEEIYLPLKTPKATPQGNKQFELINPKKQPTILIANFKELLLPNQ